MRRSSKLEINLDYLRENFFLLKSLAPGKKILPMVKADAYGNGLIQISSSLVKDCDVSALGVATLDEALEIRKSLKPAHLNVLVFSDSYLDDKNSWKDYESNSIVPVIHRKTDLEIFLTQDVFKKKPLIIKLNTGMNRLGLHESELEPYLSDIKERGIDHLMSHFSSSYYKLKSGDRSFKQLEKFLSIKNNLLNSGIEIRETSVSNSGAIEQKLGLSESTIRPGLMLYGPWSTDPSLWEGKQISRLSTKVLKTFVAKKGTPIGYGINVLGEDAFVIILSIGYGDGFSTFMSGVEIDIEGHKGKIFGRVNMDMTYVIFNPQIEGKIKENQIVEIWGQDNKTIPNFANQMRTNSYQIMTGISSRIPKIYLKK